MYELFYSAQQRNILDKSNVDENINNNRHFVVIHSDYESRDLKHHRNNTLPANCNVGNLYTHRKHIRNPFIYCYMHRPQTRSTTSVYIFGIRMLDFTVGHIWKTTI